MLLAHDKARVFGESVVIAAQAGAANHDTVHLAAAATCDDQKAQRCRARALRAKVHPSTQWQGLHAAALCAKRRWPTTAGAVVAPVDHGQPNQQRRKIHAVRPLQLQHSKQVHEKQPKAAESGRAAESRTPRFEPSRTGGLPPGIHSAELVVRSTGR